MPLISPLMSVPQCQDRQTVVINKPSVSALFLSRQYSRRVDDGNALQYRVAHVGTLEPVKERVAELGQRPELFLGVDDQSVPRHDSLHVTMHHRDETVRRRLRANPQPGEILHTDTRTFSLFLSLPCFDTDGWTTARLVGLSPQTTPCCGRFKL